jgi:fibronectin-binding autotransporter adhesin
MKRKSTTIEPRGNAHPIRTTPLLALAAGLAVPLSAQAVTYTWNSTTGGGTTDWNTAANWNPSTNIPGSLAADIATFADPTGLNTTSNVSSSVALTRITFSAAAIGYDITASASQTISLSSVDAGSLGGSDSVVITANASGTNTINADIILSAAGGTAQAFNQGTAGGTLVLNGDISSTNALTSVNFLATGASFITLGGTNTYSANSRISGSTGRVDVTSIGNASASGNLGAGSAIEFVGGTLRYTGSGETTTKGIRFVNTAAGGGTIDASGATALNISGAVNSAGGATITQTLTLKGDSNVIENKISGNITDGNGPVSVIVSTGQWSLSGNNAYTGLANRVIAGSARLNVNSATALGTGKWDFDSGATIDNTSAGAVIVNSNPTYDLGGITFKGTQDLNLGAGAATIGQSSTSTITVDAKTLTFDGAIGQTAAGKALTKAGAGTLVLNGDNTYTGATTVSAGTLLVNGDSSASTGAVAVNAGGTLGGSGTIGGAVAVASSSTAILAPGTTTDSTPQY